MASSLTYDQIQLAISGNQQAASEIVRVLMPIFTREAAYVVAKVRGTQEDVKQLVNDIFADLFDKGCAALKKYRHDGGASPEGYFRKFARYKCQSFRRAERNSHLEELNPPEDMEGLGAKRGTATEQEFSLHVQETLKRLATELKDEEFELFMRRFIKEQTTDQICGELKISVAAFYQRIRRLLITLKKGGFG